MCHLDTEHLTRNRSPGLGLVHPQMQTKQHPRQHQSTVTLHQREPADWMTEGLGGFFKPGVMGLCFNPALFQVGFIGTVCFPHYKLYADKIVVLVCLDILEGQAMACSSLHLLCLSQVGFPGKQLEIS